MTAAKQATPNGLKPHYKVRVVFPGSIIHLASWTPPSFTPEGVEADWIDHHGYGDTMSPIFDWSKVVAVTWRYAA